MLLIAESGSTKTEWRLSKAGKVINSFRTAGFNPRTQTTEEMMAQFQAIFEKHLQNQLPQKLFFYGAGLGDPEAKAGLQSELSAWLQGVQVSVKHDMLAAARSTCRHEGIVCILGTGSNSCYHAYFEIKAIKGGLGYIIGDEGSGADIGRFVLKNWLEGRFSNALARQLYELFGRKPQEILTAMMLEEKPNVVMASWAKDISELLPHPELDQLIVDRFLAFLDNAVCAYEIDHKVPVDFVGSVSYYFKNLLIKACAQRDIELGKITKDPVESLVAFHIEHPEVN